MSKGNFNSIGVAGRPGSNVSKVNRSDWGLMALTFSISPNDGSEQSTGVYVPANSIVKRAFVRVFTPESTGTTTTLTVTRTGAGDILTGIDLSSEGVTGTASAQPSGGVYPASNEREEITYTLGSGDFAEIDGEVLIEVYLAEA